MKPFQIASRYSAVVATLLAGATLSAAPQAFDFKDPKGVNNVVFKLDAPLEAINGSANGISGTLTFDASNPSVIAGRLVVATSTLTVPNPMMNGHLRSDAWLDAAKYPEIVFEAKSLTGIKTKENSTTATITGSLTIKGVTKEMSAPVTLTYLPDKLGLRVPNMKGDLLVIRTQFQIKRSDYGINPGAPQDKVNDTIDLTLSLAGASPK